MGLIMLMQRSHKGNTITALGVANLNHETFVSVRTFQRKFTTTNFKINYFSGFTIVLFVLHSIIEYDNAIIIKKEAFSKYSQSTVHIVFK